MTDKLKIGIIGAGAAGMAAAGHAAELGAEVTLFDKNDRPGRKLAITGKGRCNLTNYSDIQNYMANIPTNPRFLYGALCEFTPSDTMTLLESLGVKLKVERGNRVFPESDKAYDIVDALKRYSGSARYINEKVISIDTAASSVIGLTTSRKSYAFDRVILAAGGASYPRTGSTGDGYALANALGHTIVPPKPSLVPLCTAGDICRRLCGLSLKNINFTVTDTASGKTVFEEFGELLFAHFGLTGPVVLSASAHLKNIVPNRYTASIDLKPALDEKTLDNRLLSDFSKYKNKDFANSLDDLLPAKLIPVAVELSGIPGHKKVNEITKAERHALVMLLKHLDFKITGTRPIDEAIITSGGVSVGEISPKDMQSKLVRGLYFAGEVIDVDAYTGGYNLQIAFSTARRAATGAVLG